MAPVWCTARVAASSLATCSRSSASPTSRSGAGASAGGPDATPFPDDWRAVADSGYGLDITPRAEAGVPHDAVEVIQAAVDGSPSAPTIVALGPLTNLEDAFAADPTLPDRIAGIHAMLGTVAAPGNVFVDGHDAQDPLEWNAFADPSAVEAVFATDVPIDLVPLDATDDVPVPSDLVDRLAADHAAAGADLVYELLLRNPGRMDASQGQQLWDELAALALSDQDLVTWNDADVLVGEGGRLTQDAAGRPVRYAATADAPAVKDGLLAALRRGAPRATPFSLAGTITVTWDGTTCAATVDGAGPGLYTVHFTGPKGTPSGVLLGGVRSPHTWSDVTDLLETVDLSTETATPDWIVEGAQVTDGGGTGTMASTTAVLDPLTYGPVCVRGTWPDLTFTPGEPFVVEADRRDRAGPSPDAHDAHDADSIQIPGSGSAGSPPTSANAATARCRCGMASSSRPASWSRSAMWFSTAASRWRSPTRRHAASAVAPWTSARSTSPVRPPPSPARSGRPPARSGPDRRRPRPGRSPIRRSPPRVARRRRPPNRASGGPPRQRPGHGRPRRRPAPCVRRRRPRAGRQAGDG